MGKTGESDIVIYFAAGLQPTIFIQEKVHTAQNRKREPSDIKMLLSCIRGKWI